MAICSEPSGEERSWTANWSPIGGELDQVAGADARHTWHTQIYHGGVLEMFYTFID